MPLITVSLDFNFYGPHKGTRRQLDDLPWPVVSWLQSILRIKHDKEKLNSQWSNSSNSPLQNNLTPMLGIEPRTFWSVFNDVTIEPSCRIILCKSTLMAAPCIKIIRFLKTVFIFLQFTFSWGTPLRFYLVKFIFTYSISGHKTTDEKALSSTFSLIKN